MTRRYLAGTVIALGLVSCTVGPRFTPPAPAVPSTYVGAAQHDPAASSSRASAEAAPNDLWWHEFHDAELNRLEERVQKDNLDLRSGVLRIVEARMQVLTARAQGLPSLNASVSYNREQVGLAGILKADGIDTGGANANLYSQILAPVNLFQLGFDASWELDLFGKVRRNVEEAKAQAEVSIETRNDMLVSLEAEVATNYMQLRAAQSLKSITDTLIKEESDVLDLTISRRAHGLAQEQDVESARGQVATLRSQLPQYESNIAVARHAIAVLIGQSPEALDAELGAPADLPAAPQMIPVGLPSTLARRRPDIREAEATLHAQTANIGVAVASMYPDISLAGSFGLRNLSTGYLFDWGSKFYSAGPTVSVPIFQGGSLVANVRLARAEAGVAALNYRKTVLTALQQIEDGLANLDQDGLRIAALKDTVTADQHSFDLTNRSYKVGLSTYINVLNVESQVNQAKQQLAQASLTQMTDLVALYKALGGGWQSMPSATATDPQPASAAN